MMGAAGSNPPSRMRRGTKAAWRERLAALFGRLSGARRAAVGNGRSAEVATAAALAAAVGAGAVRSAAQDPALAGLHRLLDQHPAARRVLRHLALVELALAASLEIERLSPSLLGSALGQLERLTAGAPDAALTPLKARLARALAGMPGQPVARVRVRAASDMMSRFAESRLSVEDATLSTFESVEAMFEPRAAR